MPSRRSICGFSLPSNNQLGNLAKEGNLIADARCAPARMTDKSQETLRIAEEDAAAALESILSSCGLFCEGRYVRLTQI